ncbi:2,3-dihydro-2,3-dihydroxybenzoate dehydrogenase [Derxia gummosa]|uniref:2,3-dihydro-2,3-dihydroxybenzoate dehydrogenase n=1 Tax=Derxia gummosa DSM 723 TaxID=1121388 RepID=A0A8B6X9J1_9BURK|nr:2,3-dihydro-2,3-dihydroxybenzoate dehydrogenase [Derxia gummosa]
MNAPDPLASPDRARHDGAEFAGRVALVTGAAQGIGAAIARLLAARGARVALLDRQAEAVAATAAGLDATGLHAAAPDATPSRHLALGADLRDRAAVEQAVETAEARLGPLDIVINAAGVLHLARAIDIDDDAWESSLDINAGGLMRLCRAVAPRLAARRRGAIVAVGSNAAGVPRAQMAAYGASKAAASQYLRCLGLELAPLGVRCNLVSPGSTDTAMQRQLWTHPGARDAILGGDAASFRLGIPLGRIAEPEDIAEVACFLASDRARHITLHDLRADGGATLDA